MFSGGCSSDIQEASTKISCPVRIMCFLHHMSLSGRSSFEQLSTGRRRWKEVINLSDNTNLFNFTKLGEYGLQI